MNLRLALLCVVSAAALGGCVVKHESSTNAPSKVEVNSRLALEQCGQGNVQEVSKEGFVCKK